MNGWIIVFYNRLFFFIKKTALLRIEFTHLWRNSILFYSSVKIPFLLDQKTFHKKILNYNSWPTMFSYSNNYKINFISINQWLCHKIDSWQIGGHVSRKSFLISQKVSTRHKYWNSWKSTKSQDLKIFIVMATQKKIWSIQIKTGSFLFTNKTQLTKNMFSYLYICKYQILTLKQLSQKTVLYQWLTHVSYQW